jgi:hypothetical protein
MEEITGALRSMLILSGVGLVIFLMAYFFSAKVRMILSRIIRRPRSRERIETKPDAYIVTDDADPGFVVRVPRKKKGD